MQNRKNNITAVTVIYTDGACSGNPGPGGWAWVVPNGPYASGAEKHTTNQRMEVTAALDALRSHPGPVKIMSDSKYVVDCVQKQWWKGWIARGWQNSKKQPVANQDLWMPFVEILRSREAITFQWVKAHAQDPMNHLADALAVQAGRRQENRRGTAVPADIASSLRTPKQKTEKHQPQKSRSAGPPPAKKTHPLVKEYALAVTGARPPELGGYGPNPTADQVRKDLVEILQEKKALQKDLVILTGLSLGAEQLAAEAALIADVPFLAVLAFPDIDAPWPASSQQRFRELLAGAQAQIVLRSGAPTNKQDTASAFAARDRWLSEHADEAVLVFPPADSRFYRLTDLFFQQLGESKVTRIAPSLKPDR